MYKFSLTSVLNYRKTLEENHQKDLIELKQNLAFENGVYHDLKLSLEKHSNELTIKRNKSMTVAESMMYATFITKLSDSLDLQKKKILEAEMQVEQKRQEVLVAMKNRKVLENLKDKSLKKYNQDMIKEEQEFMNEMATVRFKPSSEQ